MKRNTIGSQVEKLRKKNGLSQEALAEKAGLNLRTIQRIENNESVPRGDSLLRIAETLNVTPDEIMEYDLVEDKTFLLILNISALAFFFFPLFGILIPLIFWVMKRDKIKDVDFVGKKILNFQLTWAIIVFSGYLFAMLSVIFRFDFIQIILEKIHVPFSFLVFGNLALYAINLIFVVLNEFLIFKEKQVFYKPAIRFFR